ncbi:hypothetical protein I302_102005 [Kwoniella bestiolae CBS 10118]|uniref:DUF7702 domain-containing protein n=1 Tax=Kwoniella bestiolae CBS 10118 TaxID=1296100 RepID=A0A1B9GDT0_9TREE|nr:hypothetical protein I302_00689 [Kwoniella bestiolae CBS 10118]OCF29193.1 hypothetical protein I302_00689 [Kwoniella bestiolae CBS 10118]
MSSTPTSTDYSSLSNINFTGGFPTSADLAPSIVFLVIYAFAIPLLLFRWFRRSDRTTLLIRPTIFLVCRIGMLVIRAYMSKNTYGEGLLIAELVLVSIGFLFLIEPVIGCWKLQIDSDMSQEDRPRWVKRLATLLKLTLLAAIITAIVGSSMISQALGSDYYMSVVKSLRHASSVLSFCTVVIAALAAILTSVKFSLDKRGTIFILSTAGCLIVVAVYRMVQNFTTDHDAPVNSRVAFWVLQMVFELFAFLLILGISIPTWFPGDAGRLSRNNTVSAPDVEAYQMRDGQGQPKNY